LTAATRLFREHGIHATGVDAITKEVGLTHGSLYSQFGSKEAIATEAIRFAVTRSQHLWRRTAERKPGAKAFRSIVESYLSREHRDEPGQGCIIAALGADIARPPHSVREAFTKELQATFELLAQLMPHDNPSHRSDDAIATLSSEVLCGPQNATAAVMGAREYISAAIAKKFATDQRDSMPLPAKTRM